VTNSLATQFPAIAVEWHPTKNGELTPDQVVAGSGRKFWWRCPQGPDHEWESTLNDRTGGGKGCPCCAGKKVSVTNSLATLFPAIAAEWDPTKNGELTPDQVVAGSNQKFWWQCPQGPDHEWEATLSSRTGGGNGCSCCAGKKVSVTNSLATLFPAIAAEWHPTRNGELTPDQVVAGSNQKFWWRCPQGPDHEWEATLVSRTSGESGCPCCAGQKVSVTNSLATQFPAIAAEWHPTKNGELTPDQVVAGSHKKFWWRCPQGPDHEWEATLDQRTSQETGCPFCDIKPRSKQEIYLAFELLKFIEFDIDEHKIKVGKKILDIDIIIKKYKLVIEFDGSYWHKNKVEDDVAKTKKLIRAGWHVIRLREKPLKKITKDDIVFRSNDIKQAANRLLLKIVQMHKVKFSNLQKYIKYKKCINQKAANIYIDKLLADKYQNKKVAS